MWSHGPGAPGSQSIEPMIFASRNLRNRRLAAPLMVAAMVAVLLFVAAPYLLDVHRHSDPAGNAHCVLCLLASARADTVQTRPEIINPLLPIGEFNVRDEISLSLILVVPQDVRAPPAA